MKAEMRIETRTNYRDRIPKSIAYYFQQIIKKITNYFTYNLTVYES